MLAFEPELKFIIKMNGFGKIKAKKLANGEKTLFQSRSGPWRSGQGLDLDRNVPVRSIRSGPQP